MQASEVERQLSLQVHALREDFREKNSSTSQHIIRLESLQAEVSPGHAAGGAGALLFVGAASALRPVFPMRSPLTRETALRSQILERQGGERLSGEHGHAPGEPEVWRRRELSYCSGC